jgi:SAM-dependent methyltransferase
MNPSTNRILLALLLLGGAGCAHESATTAHHAEHHGPGHEHHGPGHEHHGPAHARHAHGKHHGGMRHSFENAEAWAKHFDDPARDTWQQPDAVVAALKLPADARVADIGSGTGYFAVRLARAVPQGRVYGVDIEPDMTRYLDERARREGLNNLVAVQGEPADPRLPEPVDLVLVVNTYHHIDQRVDYLQRLADKLRPGGRVAIVDFHKESPRGPSAAHKLAPEQVRSEFEAAGYRLAETHDFLPDQYLLVFSRR